MISSVNATSALVGREIFSFSAHKTNRIRQCRGRWDDGRELAKSLGQHCTRRTPWSFVWWEHSLTPDRERDRWFTPDYGTADPLFSHLSPSFLSPHLSPSVYHWCHSCPWNATLLWLSSPPSFCFSTRFFFLPLTPSVPGALEALLLSSSFRSD